MSQNTEKLEKLKLWSQILATIAVPIVIVIIGNQVQQSIAEREVGKSYVQMAIEILKVPPSKETVELRQWAVATVDKLSPIPLSRKVQEQLESGKVELRPVGGGLIKYIECEPVKDKETAKWLLENEPYNFQECPKDNEIGVFKYKAKHEGPLQSGESLVTFEPITDRMKEEMKSFVHSIECRKVKDKETAVWLLKNYQSRFYKCPKDNEVGVEVSKKVDN